jgi:Domain of unknown function (DUF4258)
MKAPTATKPGFPTQSHQIVDGYLLSRHALDRMSERDVSLEDLRSVLRNREVMPQIDASGISHYRAMVRSRPIRVTFNAVSNIVITVTAAPQASHHVNFEWFSIGASVSVTL